MVTSSALYWRVCADDLRQHADLTLVAGVTDMRHGFTSLSAVVQSALDKSPLLAQASALSRLQILLRR